MSNDLVFLIANYSVMPFWLLLIVAPHIKLTKVLVHSGLIPVIYGCLYVVYLAFSMTASDAPEGASMGSLQGLILALSVPESMVAAWTHYLVFDLFVGAWMTRDAKRAEIPHWVIVVPLILTLMAGPFGLLLYVAVRGIWKQRFTLIEQPAAA